MVAGTVVGTIVADHIFKDEDTINIPIAEYEALKRYKEREAQTINIFPDEQQQAA